MEEKQAEVVMGTSPDATDTRQKCTVCGMIYTNPALETCPYLRGPGMDAAGRALARCVFVPKPATAGKPKRGRK